MIKACLIGISGFGEVHYKDLLREQETGRAKLLAATVINPGDEKEKCENLARMGCEIFPDYQTMLAKFGGTCDLCFIPSGIHLHAPMTIAALRAGCNVFVEKPIAATIQQSRRIREECDRTGRFVAVGYQHIYTDYIRFFKNAILENRLGRILSISGMCLWPRNSKYYSRNSWAGRLRVGDEWVLDSPFNNANAHMLNSMLFLAGGKFEKSAAPVSVRAELYRANNIESADTATIRISTEGGIPVHISLTHACEETEGPVVELRGEKGYAKWTADKMSFIYGNGVTEECPLGEKENSRERIFDHLLARLSDKGAFICDPGIAEMQTLAANGAHKSCPAVKFVGDMNIYRVPSEKATLAVIEGIEDLVRESFAERKLISELDGRPSWATPTQEFSLENFSEFSGI